MNDTLDLTTVPIRLPARHALLQELGRTFAPLSAGGTADVEVVGPTGSGKTTSLQTFLAALPEAFGWPPERLDQAFVPCTPSMRVSGVVTAILRTFVRSYPTKGFSQTAMLEDLARLIKTRARPLIVVLDDHHWMRDGKAALGTLLDLRARHQLPMSLVVVREAAMPEGPFRRLAVKPYTRKQAREVVISRIREAQLERRIAPGAVEVMADIGSSGGMKRAVLALRSCRETLRSQATITRPDALRLAGNVHARFNQERLEAFSDHHLFILRALCKEPGPVRSRRLRDAYWAESESRHEKPLANVQFLKYVAQLARAGFLTVKPLRGGVPGGSLAVELQCDDIALVRVEVDRALDLRDA